MKEVSRALDDEHRATLDLLGRAGQAFARAPRPGTDEAAEVSRVAASLAQFIDEHIARHFGFEEAELFPRLADAGDGDLAELLPEEHVAIRAVAAGIAAARAAAAAGTLDDAGFAALKRGALELVERLVRAHPEGNDGAAAGARRRARRGHRPRARVRLYVRMTPGRHSTRMTDGCRQPRTLRSARSRARISTPSSPSTRRSKAGRGAPISSAACRRRCDEPELHAQFAAAEARGLAGYILARVLEGEFGRSEPALRLEVVGVRADAQGHGVGDRLFDALADWARRHDVRDLRTQAAWNDHRDGALARRDGIHASRRITSSTAPWTAASTRRRVTTPSACPSAKVRRTKSITAAGRQRLRAARARHGRRPRDASRTTSTDIVRIDRDITGRDRERLRATQARETMADSAIRVSLTARLDGGDRRLPDGARRSRRLRPHRADGGHRHDRRRSRLRASRHRPRSAVATVRQSRRVARRARGNDRRAARPRVARLLLRRRIRAVAAPRLRAAAR